MSNSKIRGFVRLDKSGDSGILVVYTSTRQLKPEKPNDKKSSKARYAAQILLDAMGRDDIKIQLVSGEDWTARSESADRSNPPKIRSNS